VIQRVASAKKPGTTSGKGSRPGRELQRRHPADVEGELGGPQKSPAAGFGLGPRGFRRAAQGAWTLRAQQTNHNQGRVFPLQNQLAGCVIGNRQTTDGVQTSDAGRAREARLIASSGKAGEPHAPGLEMAAGEAPGAHQKSPAGLLEPRGKSARTGWGAKKGAPQIKRDQRRIVPPGVVTQAAGWPRTSREGNCARRVDRA
jgi:hypothetical protein